MEFLFFLFIPLFSAITASSSKPEADALLKWKTSFISQNNPLLSSWSSIVHQNTTPAHCNWYGVRCDDNYNVKELNLSSSRLNGTLNHFTFSCFTSLTHLGLKLNEISGGIPPGIKYLSNLISLDLSGSHFSGIIPPEIGMLTNLETLRLNHNQFSGSIPASLGNLSKLEQLYLNDNLLTGEIPHTIGRLSSLRLLNLSHNSLTGGIPIPMGDLTLLEALDLSSNKMVGEIPSELTILTSLAVVNFSQNRFQGSISEGGQFNSFGNDSYQGNIGLCGFPLTNSCGDDEVPFFAKPIIDRVGLVGFYALMAWVGLIMGVALTSCIICIVKMFIKPCGSSPVLKMGINWKYV